MTEYKTSKDGETFTILFTTDKEDASWRVQKSCKDEVDRDRVQSSLLPCPFCGSRPRMRGGESANGTPYFYVYCDGCSVSVRGSSSEEKAAAEWNRRPKR